MKEGIIQLNNLKNSFVNGYRLAKGDTFNSVLESKVFTKEERAIVKSFIKEMDLNTDIKITVSQNLEENMGMMTARVYPSNVILVSNKMLYNNGFWFLFIHELIHHKQTFGGSFGFTPLFKYSEKAVEYHNKVISNNDINKSFVELESYLLTALFIIKNKDRIRKEAVEFFESSYEGMPEFKTLVSIYKEDDMIEPIMKEAYKVSKEYFNL